MNVRFDRRNLLRALAGLSALPLASHAQDRPAVQGPLRIVVPLAPGTAVDVVARWLAPRLSQVLGVPVFVENKVGANGIIGSDQVAQAPADGRTLLMNAANHYVNKWLVKSLPYDPVADFLPVAKTGTAYLVLVAPADSPFRTLQDLLARARSMAPAPTYSSAGNGSTTHLCGVRLASMAQARLQHVPYSGAAQAITDVAGGQVDLTFAGIATALPHLKAGRVRALGVTGPKRSQSLPDVPTIAEAGLPGYALTTFMGAFARRGTPEPVAQLLSDALMQCTDTAGFREFCGVQGIEPDIAGLAAFGAECAGEPDRWLPTLRSGGLV